MFDRGRYQLTQYKIGTAEHALQVVRQIQSMITRCNAELDKLYNGNEDAPPMMDKNSAIWADMCNERIEYLEGLLSKLKFMLDYPERDQVV